MNLEYLQQLVAYWRDKYDWRAQERRLNAMPQFKTTIDGLDIHFVHRKSSEPNAFPIVMIHGWPGTFFEFHKMVEPLADPRRHGGDPKDAFNVVVVSLPGYGFSERPSNMGHSRERTAKIFIELMKRLGYRRYGVQAGDVGYAVAVLMALNDPNDMAGLQLNRCSGEPPDPTNRDAGLTAEEIRLRDEPRFGPDERAYSQIQGTKPQTLGYALNDSPVGLAAWIVEKYRKWCDCDGDPEKIFTKDELLTTVMILLGDGDGDVGGALLLRGPAHSGGAVRSDPGAHHGANRLHGVSRRAGVHAPELGREVLQHQAVHDHAEGRPLCRARAAGASDERAAGVLPGPQVAGALLGDSLCIAG